MVAKIQNINESGSPILTKSIKRYCPGANTIRFVWYPTGVIKQVDAPNAIATKNGLGSTSKPTSFDKTLAKVIANGTIMTPIATLEINAVKKNEMK